MNRDDVRMVQCGGGARLALETFDAIAIPGQLGAQDLERDTALKLGIRGQVDLAHSPFAEQGNKPIVSEDGADHARSVGLRMDEVKARRPGSQPETFVSQRTPKR